MLKTIFNPLSGTFDLISEVTLAAVGSTPSANGASIANQVLTLQPADGTHPGLLTAGAQNIGGAKTFTGAISASNLSGTNTGDVTLGTASGLSLVGQALSLGLASAGVTGALSGTDWSTFNNKQAAGNYITALTGDVAASGPGSAAASIQTGVIVNSQINAAAAIAYSKLNLTSSIVNADVSASAAIAYSKLNLSSSIVNADVSASAAIAYSKLNLATSIVNGDISASAAIAYSKLNLTGSVVNADISASAAIAFSKLATLTSANILVGNVSNVATAVAVTGDVSLSNGGVTAYSGTVPLNKGGTGQTTKAPAFDALSPMSASGDIIYGGTAGTGTRLAKGSDGQVLTLVSGLPAWGNTTGITSTVWTNDNTIISAVNGFGTVSGLSCYKKRVGDTLFVRATWTNGTVAGSTASVTVGGSLAIDSAKLPATAIQVGSGAWGAGSTQALGSQNAGGMCFYDGSDTATVYITYAIGLTGLSKQNASAFATSSRLVSVEFSIPISGWTQNN